MKWVARGCVTAALCLAAVASACAAPVTLAGGDGRLWRVVYDEKAQASDIYVRLEDRWIRRARSVGPVAAAFAANGRLHVFFASGGYAWYDPSADGATVGTLWDAPWRGRPVLAACAGAAEDASYNRPLYVLLGPPNETAEPATQPAEPAAALLVQRGGRWTLVAGLDSLPFAADGRVYLADVPGKGLFLLACTVQGWPAVTLRCDVDAGTWAPAATLDWPAGHRVGWWMAAGADLMAAGLSDAGPWLCRVDPVRGDLGPPAVLARDGEPLPVGGFDAMSLTPLGLALKVAWREDGGWRLGTADVRSGAVTAVGPMHVPVAVSEPVQFQRWFRGLFVLTSLLVLIMVAQRLRGSAASSFALPVEIVPALWPLRMLAAALDALPLLVIVSAVGAAVAPQAVENLPRRLEDLLSAQVHDPVIAWLTLAWFTACVAYGIVTEALFGATPAKRLLGMRVVGSGGGRPPILGVVLRNLTKPLEVLTPLVLVFLVWPLLSAYRQRAGDMLSGTAVVMRGSLEAFDRGGSGGGEGVPADRLGPPPPPPPE
ncbi:MAG: RDD family protein [Planctomycetes bacterium]|nr:RDD family protein [Planctomycetota bacterium]